MDVSERHGGGVGNGLDCSVEGERDIKKEKERSIVMGMKFSMISVVSLCLGLLIGALGQASRMCFVGGWRDFFLIRDKYLLKGFIAFFVTAALLFFLFDSAGYYLNSYPWFSRIPKEIYAQDLVIVDNTVIFSDRIPANLKNMDTCELMMLPPFVIGTDILIPGINIFGLQISNEMILALVGAFILGFASTIANGCPMRQHVMAGSGNASSMLYLLGFYAAVPVYSLLLASPLEIWVNGF